MGASQDYAGNSIPASEHSVVTPWNDHEVVIVFGRSDVVSLLDDSMHSIDTGLNDHVNMRRDILIVSDDRPARLAEVMTDRLVKSLTLSESPHTEKDYFRQFEERRRDGSFRKRRRK